ncbi:hypothetical protein BO71DRAFT_237178 [Aspergillus ellipticus CBS 707.79]|uniref:Uncharacterized protein n=1 Tax=Aspergillus ellipticus CBS 707.79 TaxID=1448320 RepID=A0A319F328_9EURO|nr:hypothetical protein BO71DRAFT_237178 [Aspergillus ellipticus CBS 707.79]
MNEWCLSFHPPSQPSISFQTIPNHSIPFQTIPNHSKPFIPCCSESLLSTMNPPIRGALTLAQESFAFPGARPPPAHGMKGIVTPILGSHAEQQGKGGSRSLRRWDLALYPTVLTRGGGKTRRAWGGVCVCVCTWVGGGGYKAGDRGYPSSQ